MNNTLITYEDIDKACNEAISRGINGDMTHQEFVVFHGYIEFLRRYAKEDLIMGKPNGYYAICSLISENGNSFEPVNIK